MAQLDQIDGKKGCVSEEKKGVEEEGLGLGARVAMMVGGWMCLRTPSIQKNNITPTPLSNRTEQPHPHPSRYCPSAATPTRTLHLQARGNPYTSSLWASFSLESFNLFLFLFVSLSLSSSVFVWVRFFLSFAQPPDLVWIWAWWPMEGMRKKAKKGAMLPPLPYHPVNDAEARSRLKMQGLVQDFVELQKEAVNLRNHLQAFKQKKLTLTAEVRFLRRRLKFLTKTPLQVAAPKMHIQTNKKKRKMEPMQAKNKEKEPIVEKPRQVIDLNQISFPRDEDAADFQVPWEPLKGDKVNIFSTGKDALANKLSLQVFKDVPSGPSRAGKRKITWQDQVALRV